MTTALIGGPLSSCEFVIVSMIGFGIVSVIPISMVFCKAGLSPKWALIEVLPFGMLILPFLLAFINWPNLKEIPEWPK